MKSQPDEARITFPCDYPIKVVGEAHETYEARVVEVARRHDPTLTAEKVSGRNSSGGNYRSVTLMLRAESEAQIQALFTELKRLEFVRLVL